MRMSYSEYARNGELKKTIIEQAEQQEIKNVLYVAQKLNIK